MDTENNNLHTIKITVNCDWSKIYREVQILQQIRNMDIDNVYSVLVLRFENYWSIQLNIFDKGEYNTLLIDNILQDIFTIIDINKLCNTSRTIIGYIQPSIELMLRAFNPLIVSITYKAVKRWQQLDFDTAYDLAQVTMFELYNKNYYIHLNLFKQCYNNNVLLYLRSSKKDTQYLVSLEEIIVQASKNDTFTIQDTLIDKEDFNRRVDQETDELRQSVFRRVKDILILYMGERQFNQLLRDYQNHNTTSWSRTKMHQIRQIFTKYGWTISDFLD